MGEKPFVRINRTKTSTKVIPPSQSQYFPAQTCLLLPRSSAELQYFQFSSSERTDQNAAVPQHGSLRLNQVVGSHSQHANFSLCGPCKNSNIAIKHPSGMLHYKPSLHLTGWTHHSLGCHWFLRVVKKTHSYYEKGILSIIIQEKMFNSGPCRCTNNTAVSLQHQRLSNYSLGFGAQGVQTHVII